MVFSRKKATSKRDKYGHVEIDIASLPRVSFQRHLQIEDLSGGHTEKKKERENITEELCVSVDYREKKILPLMNYQALFSRVPSFFFSVFWSI